jgi:mannose-1-phosphate guanylyltransferase
MNHDLAIVIMSGGSGTRFWPVSTPALPKQFITAFTEPSLFRQTVERSRDLVPFDRMLVVTSERFGSLIRAQSPEIPAANIILEPRRRDTAAAIALASLVADRRWPDSVLAVLPSDHLIQDRAGFRRTVEAAARHAARGGLLTIGIPPSYPATAYGYLQLDAPVRSGKEIFKLRRFVEKPKRERAEEFIAGGDFLWNSGIFVWKTSSILQALERHLPAHLAALRPAAAAHGSASFAAAVRDAFDRIESISIDFGVMEKASEVYAVPAAFDWSDVGGWKAAKDFVPADAGGNRIRGPVSAEGAKDCLIIAEGQGHPVIAIGVEGLVIVSTPGGTLVCREDQVDSMKRHVEKLIGGA